MLTALEIENFKPFGSPQNAKLAPLTLVYGPNSGGKSSIIQALLLLRQSFGDQLLPLHPLIPRGDYVDLGSFKALLHRHDLNRTLRIGLSFTAQGFMHHRRVPTSAMGFPLWPRSTRRVSTDFWAVGNADERRADHPQLGRLEYRLSFGNDERDAPQPLVVELVPAAPEAGIMERLRLHREKNLNCFEWKDDESIRSYGAFLLSRNEVRSDLEDLWAGGCAHQSTRQNHRHPYTGQ